MVSVDALGILWSKYLLKPSNNNNNSKTMFMVLSSWQSHCESSPSSLDECRTAPSGRQPKSKPDDLGKGKGKGSGFI